MRDTKKVKPFSLESVVLEIVKELSKSQYGTWTEWTCRSAILTELACTSRCLSGKDSMPAPDAVSKALSRLVRKNQLQRSGTKSSAVYRPVAPAVEREQ